MLLLGGLLVCGLRGPAFAAPAPVGWQAPTLPAANRCQVSGELAERIDRALARLKEPPFTHDFILADVSFSQQRIFTEYSGDISGRMLGVVGCELACGRPASWPLDALLAELPKYQQADGHFGKPQELAAAVDGKRDMPILWGNGRLLIGLLEGYEVTRDDRALAIARRMGDYYVSTDALLDKAELVDKFGTYAAGYATCYFSGIEGLVRLAAVAKDPRYLEQAKRMAALFERTSLLDPARDQRLHSHGRLCALRGLLDLYEATGQRHYRDVAVREAGVFRSRYLLPTGGITEQTTLTDSRSEGCTEADWLRLTLQIWRLTGDDAWLELAETSLANEMAVDQFPNGGFGHHVAAQTAAQMDGYYSVAHKGTQEAYWCCSEHGPRALLEVPRYAATVRARDLYVNLYEPSESQFTLGKDSVRLSLEPREHGQKLRVRIRCAQATRFALRLRVPSWCPNMTVAGAPAKRDARGRLVVQRQWPAGESVLEVALPFRVSYRLDSDLATSRFAVPEKGPEGPASLFLGPNLLARAAEDGPAGTPPEFSLAQAKVDGEKPAVTSVDGTVVLVPAARFAAKGEGFRVRVGIRP